MGEPKSALIVTEKNARNVKPKTGRRKVGKMDTNKLAIKIADDLFQNGIGVKANRLVLELEDGSNGGGWSKKAAIDRIEMILKKNDT